MIIDGQFSVNTATWAHNYAIKPHPKTKILNNIWKLNLILKIKLFSWKLLHDALLTRDRLRNFDIKIDGDCHICHKNEETIDRTFKTCDLACNIWSIISTNCPTP